MEKERRQMLSEGNSVEIAAIQEGVRSMEENIQDISKKLSKFPLVVSAALYKTICNALCTTSAFHNSEILQCFACGKGRDDQFHFLRCQCVSFIFQLPCAFMHI